MSNAKVQMPNQAQGPKVNWSYLRFQNSKGEKIKEGIDQGDLCGAALKPGETTLEIWRGEELLVLKNVRGDVCQQCNEAYLSADVSEQLDHFLEEVH